MARRPTTGLWLSRDLELSVETRTRSLSGPSTISATMDGGLARGIMSDGRPLIDDWGTYIYAVNEDTGAIRNHGIVIPPTSFESDAKILCSGFATYPKGLIYRHAKFWGPQAYAAAQGPVYDDDGVTLLQPATPEVPEIARPYSIDIFADLWAYVGANYTDLGVVLAGSTSGGVPVGNYEDPYRLQFWDSPDIGDEMENLAKMTPFDYVEAPVWIDSSGVPAGDPWSNAWPAGYGSTQDDVRHFLRVGHPRLGRRRDDLRFMEGENIAISPPVSTSDTANMVLGIGNGDPGPNMAQSFAAIEDGRVKRIAVVTDKTMNTEAITNLTNLTLRGLQARPQIESVGVVDHPNARLSTIEEGDDIFVQGTHPQYGRYDAWVRVVGITQGESDSAAVLSVIESGQFTYNAGGAGQ